VTKCVKFRRENGRNAPDTFRRTLRAISGQSRSSRKLQGIFLLLAASAVALGVVVYQHISSPPLPEGACAGGAFDPAGMAAFASATGTSPTIACDYLPASSGWSGLEGAGRGPNGFTSTGYLDKWTGSGYTLQLAVPIIPTDSGGTPVGTLAIGATGAYDSYFATLAQNLVDAGEGNAFLRPGWEFDSTTYAWSAQTPAAEADYASYFDQIVTTMRAVPGADFKFVWSPDANAFRNYRSYDVGLAYPGNAYVDYIGVDEYDVTSVTPRTPTTGWTESLLPQLTAADEFAAARGKQLVIAEWGLGFANQDGYGDDPDFINSFYAWMTNPANNVAYENYFNSVQSVITGGVDAATGQPWPYSYPNSLAAFRADFG
jgi:Glycosyl hydrolase family 26